MATKQLQHCSVHLKSYIVTKMCYSNPSHCHCSDRQHLEIIKNILLENLFWLCSSHQTTLQPPESWASVCAGFAASFCRKLSWLSNTSTTKRPIPGLRREITKPWTCQGLNLWHMSHGTMLVYFLNSFQQTVHCHLPRVASWWNGR